MVDEDEVVEDEVVVVDDSVVVEATVVREPTLTEVAEEVDTVDPGGKHTSTDFSSSWLPFWRDTPGLSSLDRHISGILFTCAVSDRSWHFLLCKTII